MYRNDRSPAWRRDAKWLSGLLLVPALAAATLFVSLGQITARERALPLMERVLQLTLLPGGVEEGQVEVVRGIDWEPGTPLRLLPGVDVLADATEVAGFTADAGVERIAGVLAEATASGGAPAVRAVASDAGVGAQIGAALESTLPRLLRARVAEALLPSGLTDGSRVLRWQEQAGPQVQPIWQVDVRLDRGVVAAASSFELGQLVVERLTEVALTEGAAAARALLSNPNLSSRFDAAIAAFRQDAHALYVALLRPREATIASRLEQARALLVEEDAPREGLFGVASAEELAGLEPAEANALVIGRLAERAYDRGSDALLATVVEPAQRARAASAARVVDGLSAEAHARWLRWAWISGAVAFALLLALVAASEGWGRLVNPGLAMVAAAAGGALLATRLAAAVQRAAPATPPTSLTAEGAFGYLAGLLGYVAASLPPSALELLVRNHLIVLVIGGGLMALALVVRLMGLMRPRRRRSLI